MFCTKAEFGMPSKTVVLSPQSIIELAHNTMVPHGMKCEWLILGKSCPVLLGCWELLKQVCASALCVLHQQSSVYLSLFFSCPTVVVVKDDSPETSWIMIHFNV